MLFGKVSRMTVGELVTLLFYVRAVSVTPNVSCHGREMTRLPHLATLL